MLDQYRADILDRDIFEFFREFMRSFELSSGEVLRSYLANEFNETDIKHLKELRKVEMVELSDKTKVPRRRFKFKRKSNNN